MFVNSHDLWNSLSLLFWLYFDLHMNSLGGNPALGKMELATLQASVTQDMFERFCVILEFYF